MRSNIPKALFSVETDAQGSAFEVTGSSDAFKMEGDGQQLSIGKMALDGDFKQIGNSLFTGDAELTLDHFKIPSPLGETSFKGLTITSDASEHGDTLNSKMLMSVKEVIVPGSPFESVENLDFGIDLVGLDKQTVIEYQEFMQKMQNDTFAALSSGAQPQAEATEMAALMPILEGLLKEGLEINSKINATLNGKPNKIALNLELLEQLTLIQMSQFMTAPDEAIKKFDVSLDASLDKTIVDSQPIAAAFISQSPLVEAGSKDYSVDLKLGKKIELNGKSMNFGELQGLIFSSLPL